MSRNYWVYILARRSRNLYTGVTNRLLRRLVEHREGTVPGFTTRYKIFRLVHYEIYTDIRLAIAREKEIKGWRPEKKIWLIEFTNPRWDDLAEPWYGIGQKVEAERPASMGAEEGKAANAKADLSPPSKTKPDSG